MDHRTGQTQRPIAERQASMTEKMGSVHEQVQEAVDRVKSAVEGAREGFKQVQEKVDGTISAVDEMLECVQGTVHETVERMKSGTDLFKQPQQNPWLLLGGAILMGYVFYRLAHESASPLK
jgi:methyl-accepting chemotaxis protein